VLAPDEVLFATSKRKSVPFDWVATDSGAVFVHGATLWLECSVYGVVEAGDHAIVLLKIEALAMYPDVPPMVFHRSSFHELASSA